MGCNLGQLRKMKEATADANADKKVLFWGLDNAGKSTIMFQFKNEKYQDTVPTVGLNVE